MAEERAPNPSQRAVIENLTDNLLLYAGAGTGKTFTVARRIREILRLKLARPDEILCLTFTLKAAEEMKEDILAVCPEATDVKVKTIHGFCFDLIKEEAKRGAVGYLEPVVIDEEDEEEILKKLLPDLFARCTLEERLPSLGFPGGLSELFYRDAGFLRGRGFHWKIPYGGGIAYLSARGIVNADEARLLQPGEKLVCPDCNRLVKYTGNFCPRCGYDFRTYVAPLPFRAKGFRALISLVKRCRALFGLNSGEDKKDFTEAFVRLKRGGGQSFFAALSTKNGGTDEELVRAMERYGGRAVCAYNEALRKSNRLDFDDLILTAARLLTGETLSRYRARYRFITVDEMQDTSALEYAVLSRLFPSNNVLLCGDPFQTIYEWRGSAPAPIAEDFKKKYGAKEVSLSVNYRATKTLLRAAEGYLQSFAALRLRTEANAAEEGEPIRIVACKNERDEAAWIYRYLKKHWERDASSVCVLARSNPYIKSLHGHFCSYEERYGADERLSFFTVDGDYRFFKKPVVKDVLAFWSLLIGDDGAALQRIAPKYLRGVGEITAAAVQAQGDIGVSLSAFLRRDTYLHGDPYHTLLKAFDEGNLVVYDLETTGLDAEKDGAVQIAAAKIDREGNPVESFLAYIDPAMPLSKDAEKTHGFTKAFLEAHGESAKSAYEKFASFVKGAVLLGHNNLQFDRNIVRREMRELGLLPLKLAGEYDTLALAKLFYPRFRNYKLATLCETFGIVNERAHDAASDIRATAKAFVAIAERNLVPTALSRIKFVKKYAPRFEKFYFALESWRESFGKESFPALNRLIASEANLAGRNVSAFAERDMKEIFSIGEERVSRSADAHGAIAEILSEAALAGSKMDVLLKKSKKIPVITVHQAKGCEFDTVIVAGADGLHFPSYSAVKSGNGEEEKRVFYVALTRAKKRLVFTRAAYSDAGDPRPESPYLSLLPADCTERYGNE